jgi:hypothetical protein
VDGRRSQWSEQIAEAVEFPDTEQGFMSKVLWLFALPWSVVNALLCPPVTVLGGFVQISVSAVALSLVCVRSNCAKM